MLKPLTVARSSEKERVIIAPVSKKLIKNMQDELKNTKDPCRFSEWSNILGEINYSDKTKTKIVCYPKKECEETFVIKIVIPHSIAAVVSVENEIKVLEFLKKHTELVHFPKLYDTFGCSCTITTEYPITCLVLNYFNIPLNNLVSDSNTPKEWWFHIFIEVVKTIAILEKFKINHNDIHFGNLLFEEDIYGPVKLIDFGTATSSNPQLKLKENYSHTFHGYVESEYIPGKDLKDFCYLLRDTNFALPFDIPKSLMKVVNTIIKSKKNITATELSKYINNLKLEIPLDEV
jgi:serine/threonine protein kinase